MLGIVGSIKIVSVITILGIIIFNLYDAYGDTTQWNSDISVGILESDFDASGIDVNVITTSTNSIKLEWEKPKISRNYEIIGYKIMRKTLDTDYAILVASTNSLQTNYYDMDLPENYYGYKVLTVSKPKLEPISMHGIDRNHLFFEQYSKGQELLANEFLKQNYPQYLVEPFKEINNIKLSPYFEQKELDYDVNLQKRILKEIIKADQTYHRLFSQLDKISK